LPHLVHEPGALLVRSGAERRGGYYRACIEQDIRGDGHEPANLLAEGTGIFDENGNIVPGIGPMIAPRR
jgi:hypothetical protein